MKRMCILAFAVTLALAFALPAFGFGFSFGYLHEIPLNGSKAFIGLDMGEKKTGQFNIDVYLGDMWLTTGVQTDSAAVLGVELYYVIDSQLLDLSVGGYLESGYLVGWPQVGTGNAGLYFDAVFHALPSPCDEPDACGPVALDLIANLTLDVSASTGLWALGGEIGFEVEL